MKSPHDFPAINPKRPDGIKPNGIPYKVMVIDDKEFHRKQIIQILESEGYEIIAAASNGAEALKLYESLAADLDLITTDLDMPKLDGYALMYELSHKKPKAKIVFISEETTKGVLSDLLKMGAADFILKPIQRGTILERIKAVLQKK
ncbi:MAG TPA: response regulator [Spirochaetota bacterium]|jgi:two-component system chemotaxis response regulator CheY|nr:response regulator [Spirochaetota bacterium]HPD04347.1 response regulator [Spirochaetota bacterium]HQG41339.1 response regulator [Spirochaetota bacterium]HQI37160.1 response regulator [Spirochaetota bacterium]HQK06346.1 response regulator [Spirochaetota bacterium]